MTIPNAFDEFVVSLPCCWDPGLPIAASRAGATGLLDLRFLTDAARMRESLDRLQRLARGKLGVVLHGTVDGFNDRVLASLDGAETIWLTPEPDGDLPAARTACRGRARRLGLIATGEGDLRLAAELGFDLVICKGNEAGGRVAEETCFVLLQRALAAGSLPVVAWGGIGPGTAAAARVAGAAGIVLDWQLALTRESPLCEEGRRALERFDGSETAVVPGPGGQLFRCFLHPCWRGLERLRKSVGSLEEATDHAGGAPAPDQWRHSVEAAFRHPRESERLWAMGADAALASSWRRHGETVSALLSWLREEIRSNVQGAAEAAALGPGAPLAVSHGTEFPVVQGPMTRVSDVPEFVRAVADGGALPFVALAMMRGEQVRDLLGRTRDLLGERPWGVGVLGFAERELREEQLAAIEEARPAYAIIAGGRPDQAASLEAQGIRAYLHVPSPEMLDLFVREGARRFVLEGLECGGHIGPRSSFVLWESAIDVLLQADLPPEEMASVHVLFAGGIQDALGGAMVAALAQPLVARGVKVGVVMGTAFLFTKEAVETGAIVPGFQRTAQEATRTVVLETGPGHAARCAESEYYRSFQAARRKLEEASADPQVIRRELERQNLGRLRIAAKGIERRARGETSELVAVDEGRQRAEGMYMLGQVAALMREVVGVRQLNERVCGGAAARLHEWRQRPAEPLVETPDPAPGPFDVAIVGMSCILPGARNLQEFTRNLLEGADAITEVPPDRFDVERWFSPDRDARDRTYSKWGGFLPDVRFDPVRFGMPPAALESIEPSQLLTLLVADATLEDAGYRERNPHRDRTSVIIGAGGGLGDRGDEYVARAMLPQLIEDPDEQLWSRLPEWTEDSFAGVLPNVIAGRVCNLLDLGGANFTVDAACAASLGALYAACRELQAGTSDLVLAGGTDTIQGPWAFLSFAKSGALSPRGRCRPFDESADGIAISEGLAMVALKRRRDAERDGDRVYAVIRAVAAASDGRSKGITAPRMEGQIRTLERAYAQAGFGPQTLGLYEAHGTGTALGDRTECRSLSEVLGRHGARPQGVAVGSVKSLIGHTKCAAGIAGLVKAALALHHRVLPPTIHVERPNAEAGLVGGPIYPNTELRPWVRGPHPRRAGVSSFGFGGTNFHAVLEEYEDDPRPLPGGVAPPGSAEIFLLAAGSAEALDDVVTRQAQEWQGLLAGDSPPSLEELARGWHEQGKAGAAAGTYRAAVIADDGAQLLEALKGLSRSLRGEAVELPSGVHLGAPVDGDPGKIAFLFPGQGAQHPDMFRELAIGFGEVLDCFARADAALQGTWDRPLSSRIFPPPAFDEASRREQMEELTRTDVAQPAIGACNVAATRMLQVLGVRPDMVAGHSYGELVALHAAGVLDEATLYRLSWQRGRAVVDAVLTGGGDPGGMAAVAADAEVVARHLEGIAEVWIANHNHPEQTVVSGSTDGLAEATRRLEGAGLLVTVLPVSCGFHSPLIRPARDRFRADLDGTAVSAPRLPVYANSTAAPYPADPEAIRALLADHLLSRVRFVSQLRRMYDDGARIFVEAGPRGILTGAVDATLQDRPHTSVALQPTSSSGRRDFLEALGGLFAAGVTPDLARLFAGRGRSRTGRAAENAASPPLAWLVNGGYVRRAGEPPRRLRPPARLGRAPAATPGAGTVADDAALSQFQETMRQFLRTEQTVMAAFYGGDVPEGTAPPQEAALPAEALPGAPVSGDGPVADRSAEGTGAAEPAESGAQAGPAAPPGEGAPREQELRGIIARRTGYPPETLGPEVDLESELGIDSIKRVEILTAFQRAILPEGATRPAGLMERLSAARSIREILAVADEMLPGSSAGEDASREPPAPAVAVEAGREPSTAPDVLDEAHDGAPLARYVPSLRPAPLSDAAERDLPPGAIVVTDDGEGLGADVVEQARVAGRRARLLPDADLADAAAAEEALRRAHADLGPVAALLHLAPLRTAPGFPGIDPEEWHRHADREVKGLLHLLQALRGESLAADGGPFVLAAAGRGGNLGVADAAAHPWRAGLAGLLKTVAHEWPQARLRYIECETPPAADRLLEELSRDDHLEVGYLGAERLRSVLLPAELPDDLTGPAGLGRDSVVLVTGGGRGITACVAREIARRAGCRLVLLGRTPHPAAAGQVHSTDDDPAPRAREIRATLDDIGAAGGTAEYHACDVRDPEALRAICEEVLRRHGRLDAIVHGAGVIEDGSFLTKVDDSFDRVVDTKVDALLTMVDVVPAERLQHLLLFSSVVGRTGNAGQCDYAAANATLNAIASRLAGIWPAHVAALGWGPWSGAGMVSTAGARRFRERNYELISPGRGSRAAWQEMESRGAGEAVVLFGKGPWAADADLEPMFRPHAFVCP